MARTKRLPANAGKDKTEHFSGLRVYDGNAMNDTQNTPESVRLRDNLPTPTQMAPVTGLPVTPYSQEASIGASFPAVDPDTKDSAAYGHESGMRERISNAKRVVVKIGSSSLTNDEDGHTVDPNRINTIVNALQARMEAGSDLIVVSSGAVAAGMVPLGLSTRPTELAVKQAAGKIRLDDGAVEAVTSGGKSLLAVGITEIIGDFQQGEIVEILGPAGQIIGRGEVSYDSDTLQSMVGMQTQDLPDGMQRPVVHADYLSNYASRA